MNNVARILSMMTAHPVIFVVFCFIAIPILIYAFIFDVCRTYVFPVLGNILKPLIRDFANFLKIGAVYLFKKLAQPRQTARSVKAFFLRRKRLKRDKKKAKQLKVEQKLKRVQISRDAKLARIERVKRKERQKNNYRKAELAVTDNTDDSPSS